ncbi:MULTISPECIES: hypothetical protein [unclassified Pseudomonas]|uniref:hypothetical protein n=1 Tax=unclassified Pseudomonas TaxID=196821 RepID=UPI000BDB2A16|nr:MULTISPECIES: hypothetical protein [unclassified Pseudomonas]PVZ19954.1 hypothetical protein F474_00545 [Pseudomonas sp. URIL14HWK12:I12]PVZ27020.1 hypothetical protein F470_00200 [Pseudomonas sp. URIL14HWK12:I10]PVZ37909.1 hypothetical protein F472_00545 [Pseudomonas sp. URIL14HWK12:I11]SNZ05183.1 hypothetical protein SAMN05660463_00859 [Pseudomonas sp. URIL14HWK12:I9]
MKRFALTAGVFAVAVLGGCVSPPPPQPRIAFPVAEYQSLPKAGTGIVEGQVFMRTIGGDVKYGAGSEVTLNPMTSYSQQWYRYTYELRQPLQPGDPRQEAYVIRTQADGNGNFRFTDVPPGQYYLTSRVTWQAPTQYGLTPQGGWLTNRITVKDGQSIRSMLTQ